MEETIYMVDEEEEGGNGEVRTMKKQSEMLFVRGTSQIKPTRVDCMLTVGAGDSVVLISPQA